MTAVLQPLARWTGEERAFWAWMGLATVLGLALRLFHLDVAGFWVDELYSVYATPDLSEMHRSKVFGYVPVWVGLWLSGVNPQDLPHVGLDSSMWQALGVTHQAARLGPALVGAATVPLVAIASRRMIGTGPACILAVLLAIAPWHIYWSQAARYYSLQFLFYTLAVIYYFTATEAGSAKRFVVAMVFVVLAFFSQPTALAVLPIFAADWLIGWVRRQPVRLGVLGWVAGIAAVGLCGLVLLSDYRRTPSEWSQFVSFGGAQYQPPHKLMMGMVYMTGPAVAVAALATAWALWRKRPRLTIYLLLAALLPVGLFALWSLRNAVGLRYLFVVLYGWLALAAIGIDRVGALVARRSDPLLAWGPLAVVMASSAIILLGYYESAKGFHPRWPEAYAYVRAHQQQGDVVACRHVIVGRYYMEDPRVTYLPQSYQELRDLGERVWMVVEQESTSERDIDPWVYEVAEIKKCQELGIPRPISRVAVLYYERGHTDRHVRQDGAQERPLSPDGNSR